MKQEFPHYLTAEHLVRGDTLRVVTDRKLSVGDQLFYKYDVTGERLICDISEIIENRPAMGDWSGWESHPDYYKVRVCDARKEQVENID